MSYALVSGVAASGLYLLVSLGFVLLLRVADIVNIAHGSVVVGGMYLTIVLVGDLGVPYGLAIPLTAVAGLIPAWVLYAVILRRARDKGHGPQIVYTLLLLSILESVYARVFGTNFRSLAIEPVAWDVLGVAIRREQVIGFVIAIAVCCALFLVFRFTAFGKSVEVAGKYRDGAEAIGLPVERLYLIVFLTGTAMALVAGSLVVASSPATPFLAFQYIVIAVLVAIAARLSFVGCVLASLLYGAGYAVLARLLESPTEGRIAIYLVFVVVIAAGPLVGLARARAAMLRGRFAPVRTKVS